MHGVDTKFYTHIINTHAEEIYSISHFTIGCYSSVNGSYEIIFSICDHHPLKAWKTSLKKWYLCQRLHGNNLHIELSNNPNTIATVIVTFTSRCWPRSKYRTSLQVCTMTKRNIAGTVIIELLFESVKTLPKAIWIVWTVTWCNVFVAVASLKRFCCSGIHSHFYFCCSGIHSPLSLLFTNICCSGIHSPLSLLFTSICCTGIHSPFHFFCSGISLLLRNRATIFHDGWLCYQISTRSPRFLGQWKFSISFRSFFILATGE